MRLRDIPRPAQRQENSRCRSNVQKLAAAGSERISQENICAQAPAAESFSSRPPYICSTIAHRASRAAPKLQSATVASKKFVLPILFDCRLARSCATPPADGSGGFFRQRPPLRSCSRPCVHCTLRCHQFVSALGGECFFFFSGGQTLLHGRSKHLLALHPHIVQDMQMMIAQQSAANARI